MSTPPIDYDQARAEQATALAELGFSPAFATGGPFGLHQATYCLTCGSTVTLLPADPEDGAPHPLDIHRAWHGKDGR